ncbi:hypothetical protein A2U01_0096659, partial [Trifolium medium]|nr:hypothetical protein [Trifolium medium]
MTSTLSDSDEETERETGNKAFTGKCETSSDTSYVYLTDEDMTKRNKRLSIKWKEYCLLEQQKKI